MFTQKEKKSCEFGRTMLETILVLGVLSMIAVSLMTAVNRAHDKYKISKMMQQISEIRKNVTARYLANGSYAGITNNNLIKDQVVPKNMISNNKFYHAYNGEMQLDGTQGNYTITLLDLPRPICAELATMDWRVDETTTLISVRVAGTKGASGTEYGWSKVAGQNTLPIQMGEAMSRCSGTGKTNKLILTFE